MQSQFTNAIWEEEEELKECVYSYLDHELRESSARVSREKINVASGAYDDHHAFIAHNELARMKREDAERRKLILSISRLPYFSHVSGVDEDEEPFHVLFSDNEDLDEVLNVDSDKLIVPFKDNANAPLMNALHHYYMYRQTGPVSVSVRDRHSGAIHHNDYNVESIRNVEILNKTITNVVQLAPISDDGLDMQAIDELLVQRLSENRSNATLSNIIATLQREQFDIISADVNKNFIVQGCAGSGKTQCLIHRLFFLREILGRRGWDKVLLITPSQLFRNYSSDLMRKYHLSGVANCSLANFYCTLLNAYDPRFKSRQYMFELTEEYLPDEYLQRVYAPDQIRRIEAEITRAVSEHVKEGCELLGLNYANAQLSAEFITALVKQLDEKIEEYDNRAQELSKSEEYSSHIEALDSLDKQLKALYKRQSTLEESKALLDEEQEKYNNLKYQIQVADAELAAWKASMEKDIDRYIAAYNGSIKSLATSSSAISKYRKALFEALDITLPSGKRYQLNHGNTAFLEEICDIARADLREFFKEKTEKDWKHRYADRCRNNATQMQKVLDDIEKANLESELHSKWIQDYSSSNDSIDNQRKTYRAALEKARYYLSRIESSVFEQEVWNALQPLKEECGIQTIQIEELEDGHQKRTRILYKSDLLFYVKIYAQLHKGAALPQHDLICIDEGQDLHRADYALLRSLYPKSTFNVFGDIAQALHESCGVTNWIADTGINTVFEINSNYRNTPAIVDFCNRKFNRNMAWIGKIWDEDRPIPISMFYSLQERIISGDCTVIVKSRKEFEELCYVTGLSHDKFEFLDMKADAETPGKIHCYSIYAAKGLEFPRVLVYFKNMNKNQKTVACTRAMEQLYFYE